MTTKGMNGTGLKYALSVTTALLLAGVGTFLTFGMSRASSAELEKVEMRVEKLDNRLDSEVGLILADTTVIKVQMAIMATKLDALLAKSE